MRWIFTYNPLLLKNNSIPQVKTIYIHISITVSERKEYKYGGNIEYRSNVSGKT